MEIEAWVASVGRSKHGPDDIIRAADLGYQQGLDAVDVVGGFHDRIRW